MGGIMRASTIVIAAPLVAYALGYSYYRAYFSSFGVDISAISIPIEHYFVTGVVNFLLALLGSSGPLGWVAPASAALILLALLLPFAAFARPRAIVAALASVPLLVAVASQSIAEGEADARELVDDHAVYLALPRVTDLPDSDLAEAAADPAAEDTAPTMTRRDRGRSFRADDLARANMDGALRLVWEDSDATFVARELCNGPCHWQVFRLPSGQITVMETRGDDWAPEPAGARVEEQGEQ